MHKYYYVFLLAVLTSTSALAGTDTLRRYYNEKWAETTRDSAVYSRKAWKLKQGWAVRDYYHDGTMQMTGTFTDKTFKTKVGPFTWYTAKGKPYDQGSFKNGQRDGLWRGWYEDGKRDY